MSGIASIDLQRAVGNQGANREKNSQKNSEHRAGVWEPPVRRKGHTQVRRSRARLEELVGPGVSIMSCTQGQDSD